jgi:hypothetical protein
MVAGLNLQIDETCGDAICRLVQLSIASYRAILADNRPVGKKQRRPLQIRCYVQCPMSLVSSDFYQRIFSIIAVLRSIILNSIVEAIAKIGFWFKVPSSSLQPLAKQYHQNIKVMMPFCRIRGIYKCGL